jgi:hypothetical protein
LRREDDQQDCDAAEHQCRQGEERPDDPAEFAAPLGRRILAQHRHQCRRDHAADQQVVEDGQHAIGEREGFDRIAGAKVVRRQLLAHQPKEARQQVADRDDQRGRCDTTPRSRLERAGGCRCGSGWLDLGIGEFGAHRVWGGWPPPWKAEAVV